MKASLISISQNHHKNSVIFPKFGILFWINTVLILTFALNVVFNISQYPLGHYIFSFLALIVIFFLPGQNFTALIERATSQKFSLIEKLVITTILALTIPSFIISFLSNQSTSWSSFIPYSITVISWIAAIKFAPFFWEEYRRESTSNHLAPALTIATLIIGMFLFQLTSAYYALPDLDPYYWLQQFQNKFHSPVQISLHEHRPLFLSLGYLFVEIAKIDAYGFFKYIIPFLFFITLLPATLVANRARSLTEALLVYFLPFASASFILYSTSSLPQSIANLLILSAFYSVLHATLSKQPFFFFFGGYLIIASVFFHEMGLLLLLPWLGVLMFTHYQRINHFIRQEWLSTILLFIIAILLLETIHPYISFITNWVQKVIQAAIQLQSNFAFPATYINIDGNAVGWGDTWGVIRYYAFYFGPFASLSSTILLWYTLRQRQFLQQQWRSMDWIEKNTLLYITVTMLLFLSIAEFFPRFFNLSLLPERALGFATFPIVFLLGYHFLRSAQSKFIITILLLITIGINIGASLYINSVKQYLITANQIHSAEWIRGSLPKEKIIVTGTQVNLLRFHAQVDTVIDVNDPSIYTDIRVFEKALNRIPSPDERYQQDYSQLLLDTQLKISSLEKLDTSLDTIFIRTIFSGIADNIQSFINAHLNENIPIKSKEIPPLYIYYSKENSKNPYANRPYAQKIRQDRTSLIFDQFPDRFERVYSLPEDEVIIWKMIQ